MERTKRYTGIVSPERLGSGSFAEMLLETAGYARIKRLQSGATQQQFQVYGSGLCPDPLHRDGLITVLTDQYKAALRLDPLGFAGNIWTPPSGNAQSNWPFWDLCAILPNFDAWAGKLKPALLEELLADTAEVASKMIRLQQMLPDVDIHALIKARASLLSDEEFSQIEEGITKLTAVFGEQDRYASIVQRFPNLLLLDVEDLMTKLKKYIGSKATPDLILQDPTLLMSAVDNRNMSLW